MKWVLWYLLDDLKWVTEEEEAEGRSHISLTVSTKLNDTRSIETYFLVPSSCKNMKRRSERERKGNTHTHTCTHK